MPSPPTPQCNRSTSIWLSFLLLSLIAFSSVAAGARTGTNWMRAKEPWLVIDPTRNVIDIFVAGVLLEQLPITRVSVRVWQGKVPGAETDSVTPAFSTREFLVELPPTDTVRATRLVTLESGSGEPASDALWDDQTQSPPAASATDIVAAPLPPSYEVELDDGFRFVVTTRDSRPSWWKATAAAMSDYWLRIKGTPVTERPNLLVLEAEASVAARLHPLLRPGTRLVLGNSESDQPALTTGTKAVDATLGTDK